MKISPKIVGVTTAAVIASGFIGLTGVASADSASWSGSQHSQTDRYNGSQSSWDNWRFESNRGSRFNRSSRNNFQETNNNDIQINNNVNQNARSGNVRVKDNDEVGDVYSGDATNYSTTDFNVDVQNR